MGSNFKNRCGNWNGNILIGSNSKPHAETLRKTPQGNDSLKYDINQVLYIHT